MPCGPARVRREKPRVGAFTSADVPKILELRPDLVLTFSDLQADIAAALVREGVEVHAFNQRDVAGILRMIRTVGALAGCAGRPMRWRRAMRRGWPRWRRGRGPGARGSGSRNGTRR